MAWAINGTPSTLGSAVDVITISDLVAKKFNQFLFHDVTSGDTDILLTFNNNSNTVYARRSSLNGNADVTAVSQTSINHALNFADDKFKIDFVCSISGEEKLGISHKVTRSAAGAGTAPSRGEVFYKFVPSPDADITRIDYDNAQTGSYGTDSNLSALGTD